MPATQCPDPEYFVHLLEQMEWTLERFKDTAFYASSLCDIENHMRRVRRRFDELLLKAMAQMLEDRDRSIARPICPYCGKFMCMNRREKLTLQFLEGEVKFYRNYYECRDCKVYCNPLDGALEIPNKGEVTPQFGHDLDLLAAELPGKASIRLLRTLTGRKISKSTIEQHVERDASALVEMERLEAEALWPFDERNRLREVQHPILPKLRQVPKVTDVVIAEMDGVMANIGADTAVQEEKKQYEEKVKRLEKQGKEIKERPPTSWREVRQMRIFRMADIVETRTCSGKLRRSILQSEFVSVVWDPLLFAKRVNAVAQLWKIDKYRVRVVIADGAEHLWDLAKTLLDPTVEILDYPHARKHIHDCAKALFGHGTARANKWAKKWGRALKKKGPKRLKAELGKLAEQEWNKEAGRVLGNLIDYVDTHYHRMDYPTFLKAGYPIASGAIESANRQLVGDRCKRSGMRWCKIGLQHIVSLRAALLSGNWEHICRAMRNHRSYSRAFDLRLRERFSSASGTNEQREPVQRATGGNDTLGQSRRPSSQPSKSKAPQQSRRRSLIPERKMTRLLMEGLIEVANDGGYRMVAQQ